MARSRRHVGITLFLLGFAFVLPAKAGAQPPVYLAQWGSGGSGPGQFNTAQGVATDAAGNVYVADGYNARIQKFTNTGVFITQWGSPGSGNGQFNYPWAVATDAAGNVYVADAQNNRIQKFTSTGVYITQWGGLYWPRGIATDAAGNVYVADTFDYRIAKFTSAGVFITQWGSPGSGNGEFSSPHSVATDAAGNVYVSEAEGPNQRIQKFTSTGTYITQWGSGGSGNSQFYDPYGITTDPAGNVYVADARNHRVQKFSSSGAYLTQWGIPGSGNGQFAYPVSVATDAAGHIFVVDQGNARIQKFGDTSNCAPVAISPASLPAAAVRQPYHEVLTPSGGTPPYLFSVIGGSPPPGVRISASGTALYGCDRNGRIFTIDLGTGAGTATGVVAPTGSCTEIEHDFASGATFAQGSDGTFFGQQFDILTGATIGGSVYDGGSFQGLEYVGSTLYGTYVLGGGGPSTLSILDPTTGASTVIGPTGAGPISGLAYDAASGIMYGISGGGRDTLFTVNLTTGAATIVGPTGFTAGSLEFGPDGNLYGGGDTQNGGHLYRINRLTGAATLVGATGFSSVTGLTLGPGTVGATGLVSGISTAAGSFTFTVGATDVNGCSGSAVYTIDVTCPPLTISPPSLPTATARDSFSVQLTADGSPAFDFAVAAGSLPPGLTLYSFGLINGSPTTTGSFPFTVSVTDASGCRGSIDYKLAVSCGPVTVMPSRLPNAPLGEAYDAVLTADGTPPFSFDVKSGSLPPGLALDSGGTLSGTPTAAGTFGFTVSATDFNACRGTRDYSITAVSCPPIAISPSSLPPGELKHPYQQVLTPSAGTPPFAFDLKSGSLPPGLQLSGSGRVLFGCDRNGGIFTVDVATGAGTATGVFAPTGSSTEIEYDFLSGATFAQALDGSFFGQQFDILTGTPIGSAVYDGGSFQGLEYVGNTLYGTYVNGPGGPSTLAILDPNTGASSAIGPTNTGPISGLAYDDASGIMYGISGGGRFSPTFLFTINLTTGVATAIGPTGFSAGSLEFGPDGNLYGGGDSQDGGHLYRINRLTGAATLVGATGFSNVTGLTLAPGGAGPTGLISGIPTTGGSFAFTVSATDANGCHASANYRIDIPCAAIALTPTTLPPGQVKEPYDQFLTASGGLPPLLFSVSAGSLPVGLTLLGADSSGTARISGIPLAAGTSTFTIHVTDRSSCSGEQPYTIVVSCPAIAVNPSSLPDAVKLTPYSQILTPKAGSPPFSVELVAGSLPPGLSIKDHVAPSSARAGIPMARVTARSAVRRSPTRMAAGSSLTGATTPSGSTHNVLTAPSLSAGPRILFALADFDDPSYRAAIAAITGGTVDFFECAQALSGTTPPAALLATYDCVFTKPNFLYDDRVLMGDRLADYVDAGGKVILGVFCAVDDSLFNGVALKGRIMTPGYSPVAVIPGTGPFGRGDYAGDGTTCIHSNVAAYGCNLHDQLMLQGDGLVDGHFQQDGSIAHAYRADGRVIYSNGHGDANYGPTGDWAQLIANASACNPHPVEIVISGTPVETGTFAFRLRFTDRNLCSGDQDFAIQVQDEPTAALLSLFQAQPVDLGLELRWQFADPRMFSSVGLERSAAAVGPWTPVVDERRLENEVTVSLDRDVVQGRTYFYRLVATTASGSRTIFGPLSGTAGLAIAEFALERLAPNPSAGNMRIDFTVPRAAMVRLSVLDVQGRVLAVLVNGPRAAGRYQATWNGEGAGGQVPGGLYFVQYRTPNGTHMKRAVIAR